MEVNKMGWNDHDDRLMELADEFEMAGIGYERAYEMALDIRTDEMLSGDIVSESAIFQIAEDEIEEMGMS
jgi:hypothetical protein